MFQIFIKKLSRYKKVENNKYLIILFIINVTNTQNE